MKTTTFKNSWLTAVALLLSLPTAYFIFIALFMSMAASGLGL